MQNPDFRQRHLMPGRLHLLENRLDAAVVLLWGVGGETLGESAQISGFVVEGFGFRVRGLGFGVWVLGFEVWG